MNVNKLPLLCTVFSKPDTVLEFNLTQWDLLIRQARHANVLARLGFLLKQAKLYQQIPMQPLLHIQSIERYAERFYIALNFELQCIQQALQALEIPIIVLKGAAYFAGNDSAARGRTFADIDILVPENKLNEVEAALIKAGWITNTFDPYDQNYYRQWMHEIPPLRNLSRQTCIDVHHNILPKTTGYCPNAKLLLTSKVPSTLPHIWVLAPIDKIIHSATHLFHEGEFEQGFRDLSDLDLLLRDYANTENFWSALTQRAQQLKQQTPLYYALRYTHKLLKTAVPTELINTSVLTSAGFIKCWFMDALFLRALMPSHSSCTDRFTSCARFLLFIRSHWLKMPIYLLIPHLLRKAYQRLFKKDQHKGL